MKLPAEMMKLAQHIIRDEVRGVRSVDAGGSLSDGPCPHPAKETGEAPAPPPAAAPSRENVINLMDALRRSIPAESPPPRPQRRAVAAKAASPKSRKARHRSA